MCVSWLRSNNESSEIIRILASHPLARDKRDYYPAKLQPQIDDINAWVYTTMSVRVCASQCLACVCVPLTPLVVPRVVRSNNGAYRAGFAQSQEAYTIAAQCFFESMKRLDRMLGTRKWLCGDELTEADVRLFPTVFRLEPVYAVRFRLNLDHYSGFPNVVRWAADFAALEGLGDPELADALRHSLNGYFGRTGTAIVPIF